jgi:hypothetical protein
LVYPDGDPGDATIVYAIPSQISDGWLVVAVDPDEYDDPELDPDAAVWSSGEEISPAISNAKITGSEEFDRVAATAVCPAAQPASTHSEVTVFPDPDPPPRIAADDPKLSAAPPSLTAVTVHTAMLLRSPTPTTRQDPAEVPLVRVRLVPAADLDCKTDGPGTGQYPSDEPRYSHLVRAAL